MWHAGGTVGEALSVNDCWVMGCWWQDGMVLARTGRPVAPDRPGAGGGKGRRRRSPPDAERP
jgi:hypothetical protein